MDAALFEKLGAFYLGKEYDLQAGKIKDDLLLYDSKDLTTHAVCVGMTGSGKTGLCVGLLEEAAIDGIPALIIDPKGDLGNLLLTFPNLEPADFAPWIDPDEAARKGLTQEAFAAKTAFLWKNGLAEWGQDGQRVARFRNAADTVIYTPGSSAGLPLSILRSFDAPPPELAADRDALRDRIMAAVSGLLTLLGVDADPIQSREHILLSNILLTAWSEGRNLDIARLIQDIQNPPFTKVGVFDLDSFYPAKERFGLAMALNNLLASPGFASWMEGDSLDIGRLLYAEEGRPRLSILSIAHLSDKERMFFVTLLLNEVVAWMRTQPGTSSLRAILYMDEIFGYFPPTAVPPSKTPMLTLLKQARAFGLGVVLATQNPVDLDYKGLSNTGTWFIGRLQTERDKGRVLDGLEGASAASGAEFRRADADKILSALDKRVFLLHNVHDDKPVLFHTRWALSYLGGPMTRAQIQTLTEVRRKESFAPRAGIAAPALPVQAVSVPAPPSASTSRPALPPDIPQYNLGIRSPLAATENVVYRPGLLLSNRLHFVNTTLGVDLWRKESVLAEIPESEFAPAWDQALPVDESALSLDKEAPAEGTYAELPSAAGRPESYRDWKKDFSDFLYRNKALTLWRSPELKAVSRPGEGKGEFLGRLSQLANERRDLAVEKLRAKYAPKLAALEDRRRRAEHRMEREKDQYDSQKLQSAVSMGATVLGALFGRKIASQANIGRAASGVRGMSRTAKEKQDVARAQEELLAIQERYRELEAEFQEELAALQQTVRPESLTVEEIPVKPRKSDISVSDPVLVWVPWKTKEGGFAEPAY